MTWSWARDRDRDRFPVIHPRLGSRQTVGVQALRVALLGLPHHAAERLRHDLVSKAYSDELRPAAHLTQEALERRDPREWVIFFCRRAGDHEAVVSVRFGRISIADHVEACGDKALSEHGRHHIRVGPEPFRECRRREAGL